MNYVDFDYYKTLYGDKTIPETDFNRLSWDACRKIDYYTTGVDGVKKLKVAFPTEIDDIEAVKRCVCALIELINNINQAEDNKKKAAGYVQREDGTFQGKVVSSVSAGNESISYSALGNNNATLIDMAITDRTVREQLFYDTVKKYLSGVTDANGVGLLYMGTYPYVVRG